MPTFAPSAAARRLVPRSDAFGASARRCAAVLLDDPPGPALANLDARRSSISTLRVPHGRRTGWMWGVGVAAALTPFAFACATAAWAQEAEEDIEAGAATKKVEKKGTLVEEEAKKAAPKAKRDEDKLQTGQFQVDKLEQMGFTPQERKLQEEKSRIRQRSIKTLDDLLARAGPQDQNRPEYYFRLAEAWWEETKFAYLVERMEYDRKVDQFEKGLLKEKPVQPVENYAKSIEFYKMILKQHPNYPRMAEVLYRLGKAAMQQGKALGDKVLSQDGVQHLNRLIQNHQTSPLIPKAHLALAEHFFENNNLTLAKMNYEKITQNYKTSELFNYALYKLGWVYYNLREFQRTIDTFQMVVKEIGVGKERGKIEFRDQALKDLVQAYAELDGAWPKAEEYFLSVEGEAKMWERLFKLAEIYVSIDKDKDAVDLLNHFIDKRPTDPRCVDWHETITDVFKKLGAFPDIEAAMRKWLAFSDDRTSPWVAALRSRKDGKSTEALEKGDRMGEAYLLFISNYYHQLAQKTEEETKDASKARQSYARAADDYKEFIRRWPNSKKAYIVNFYLAEIYYDQLKEFDKARICYEQVIARDSAGDYVEDAALGVIYATEELMRNTKACYNEKDGKWFERADCPALVASVEGDGVKVKVVKKDKKQELTDEQVRNARVPKGRQELHLLEKSYVAAAEKYVELMEKAKVDCAAGQRKQCNKGKKVPEIMYLAATAYYDRGQYKEAISGFERVYKYQEDHKVAEIAVKTLIDIYARHKEWPKIEEWAELMLKRKSRIVLETKDLKKYVAIAVAEQAVELAEKKDFDGAHAKYDKILARFKADEPELAATALYNKATLYELQQQDRIAIETYERVVKEFPKAKVAPEAKFNVGMLYEAMTNFREAADAFLDMAKFRDNADAAQALINAGTILVALQQYKDATAAYDKFITVANNLKGNDDKTRRLKDLVADAEMEKGHVYERMGQEGAKLAAAAYAAVVSKHPGRSDLHVEALGRKVEQLRLADPVRNRKDLVRAADDALKAFATDKGKEGRAPIFAAQAMFYKTEYLFDDFDVITLKSVKNMKNLLPTLQKKAEALKRAEADYFKVFDTAAAGGGRGWAAAAMFKIGLLYYRFKEDLFSAPVPPEVERYPELADKYKQAIDEKAVPIEEQSLAALGNAIKIAHNLGVYNKWSKEAGDYAAKVSPEAYPTVEKDPNLPKAAATVSANESTDPATSAAFVTSVRRGKFTVSYKPKADVKPADAKAAAPK